MKGSVSSPRFGALFAEDFDLPPTPPIPEVIEPVFSAADLAAAREAAWQDGHVVGLQEAAVSETAAATAATRQAIAQFSDLLRAEAEAAAARAAQEASAIAQLLMDCLATAFPTLTARYGDAEVRAMTRTVLPALTREPKITIRAHPDTMVAIAQELAGLDPDLKAHVHTVTQDEMMQGDVRITWQNGSAVRNVTALWQQIAEILVPAGLLRNDLGVKETADGK